MPTEEKARDEEGLSREQVRTGGRQDDPEVNPSARMERAVARLKKGIWFLAVFTAVICGLLVVNLMIVRKTFERVERDLVLVGELSDSLKEIQKTTVQLKKMIEELSDTEEEGNQGDSSQTSDGKI